MVIFEDPKDWQVYNEENEDEEPNVQDELKVRVHTVT
jgi:hypothetical protein